MPLRFDLAVGERLYIGRGVITNGKARSMFVLDGTLPVMKEKDVILPADAVTSLERLYVHIQQAYLYEQPATTDEYAVLAAQSAAECPEAHADLTEIDKMVVGGDLYKALKNLRKLIRAREQTAA
jgi:flagellar protein FlbT